MKYRILTILVLILSGLQLFAQPMSDKAILEAIRENPYRAAGCHCPYNGADFYDTPAPAGYTAFYVSHFGRHGSRYQTKGSSFDKVLANLDTLHNAKLLTPCGDTLRTEILHMRLAHKGMDGMLTSRGTREHTGIALNLARRCPEIFTQKDRPVANCTSTAVARTIQSMAGFSAGILSRFPGLDLRINSGFKDFNFVKAEDKQMSKKELAEIRKPIEKSLEPSEAELSQLAARLFTDPEAAKTALGAKSLVKVLKAIFDASCGAGCLDIEVDPLRFFAPEELFAFYREHDVVYNVQYGPMKLTREDRGKGAKRWARLIVDEADAALAGNGHCADFRFGHDGNVGPMMTLLGIGPFQYFSEPEAPYRDWQSFNYICMGSNVQFIFYRNEKGDVLVKTLYNEREIDYPGLKPVNKVYYSWKDVRRYIISRTDGVREVPEYYLRHLKEKSAEIAKLQKDEADGFYFITDTHFPANFGNTPALVEYLESHAGVRKVILGGDVLTYLNDMNEGMPQQIAYLEQIRGAAPVYWVRGNHDFLNYTGKKPGITAPRKGLHQWDSANILERFRGPECVGDSYAPYSAYCYFDNKEAGIRYVMIESTIVENDKLKYFISDRQLQWIAEEVILKAPQGYKIAFFSHVPPFKSNDKKNPSMDGVKSEIEALAGHARFTLGNTIYDFSKRGDLSVLGLFCAHHHSDYEKTLGNGVIQINEISDCNYQRLLAGGTVEEQAFSYFSISKDFKTVRIVGIGAAKNRTIKIN